MSLSLLSRSGRGLCPPGPKPRWLSGNVREFAADRLGFLADCARTYGDFVSIRLGPYPIMVVNHPDQIEDVLVTQNRKFIKHFALRNRTKPTLGQGLLTSEGDFWRRQRRLSQPAFHRDRIEAYGAVMVEATERMLQDWAGGQTRDVQADMMQVTLEIVAKTLFDADLTAESAGLSVVMETLMAAFTAQVNKRFVLPPYIPTPSNVRVNRALRQLDQVLYRFVTERRASGADRGDLLSMLLKATDDELDGTGMTDRQLRDELMTLFMAGHETTANTLAWAFYLLSQNPEARDELHAELDAVLTDGRPPTVADLPRLPFTGHVIAESLRVLPTVWLLGREAIEPTEVGGYPVPVGLTIYMSQWVVHRDPRWFDDPEAFRPGRWSGDLARRIPRYAYFPFGGGPRVCIGNQFALMESALLLATIARRFRLELAPAAQVELLPTMTLRPAHGLKMHVHARKSLN
ncbi:cytochrome P450 [soil metagenome]